MDDRSGSSLMSWRVACDEEMIPFLRLLTVSKQAWTVSGWKLALVPPGPVFDPVGWSEEVGNSPSLVDMSWMSY